MAGPKGLTERGREMRRLLAAQRRSGLSLLDFARQRGLRANTLSWWRHRLRGGDDDARRAISEKRIPDVSAATRAITLDALRRRHSRAGGNPSAVRKRRAGRSSMPASTGMTESGRLGTDGECVISDRFIEITAAGREQQVQTGVFEVVLEDGKVVRVPERFGEEPLRRLLAVLRGC